MASEPRASVSSPPTADSTLCEPFVQVLPIDGASIAIFGHQRHQSTICATDPVAIRSDTLQFEFGEGPHWDALTSGVPVLCPNLALMGARSWPVFTEAALGLGIGSLFAFPMKIGAAVVGVVDLYSVTAHRLAAREVSLAALMAHRAAMAAVNLATQTADDSGHSEESAPSLRREVHQATGMVQAQLDVSATDALLRLRALAFSSGRPIDEIARDVVNRTLDFSTLTQ